MALQKIQFKPGVMRDITAYTNEGGWYDCDLVRFQNSFPQSIGGWAKYSLNSFLGTCRELINWVTLAGENYLGVGTNLKFYIESGSVFNDITPIRSTVVLSGAFAASVGNGAVITVTDTGHDAKKPIGRMVSYREDEDGMYATFKISNTTRGTDALIEASEQLRSGLSVGVEVIDGKRENGVYRVLKSKMEETSLVQAAAIIIVTIIILPPSIIP